MKKQTTYILFGKEHIHKIKSVFFDSDCIAVMENVSEPEGRKQVKKLFGNRFCFAYPERDFDFDIVDKYKRGLIKIPRIEKRA